MADFNAADVLVGAALGFLSALSIRHWQYRRDLWLDRVKQFCNGVDEAAKAGVSYWLKARGTGKNAEQSDLNEALIMGLQTRLDGFFVSLGFDELENLELRMSDFRGSLTGGDFAGAQRASDPDRARLLQMYASDLIVDAWLAAYEQTGLWAYVTGMIRRTMRSPPLCPCP